MISKYLSVIIGAVVALLGLLGLVRWWGLTMLVLKGIVPAIMIFAGAIAVIAGLSEMKDEQAFKKEEKK
ncbi:MAG: hypothetical protein PHT32_06655 [Candidatus Omnitrophica bacterium]|nr:hypothetical protein [Candidatus Omnitrophota bacterium]